MEFNYKHIFDNSRIAIFIADVDTGEILECNKEAEKLVGRKRDEIIGSHQSILHPEGEVKKYRAIFQEHVQKGEKLEFEATALRKDGSYVPITISARVMDMAGRKIIVGFFSNITEIKKAAEQIKQISNEWQRTFDAVSDFVFILDEDYTVTRANKPFIKALKLKPEEIIGKKCYELLHKSDTFWPDCPFEDTKKDKRPHVREIDDPNIGVPLLVATSPIFDDKGEFIGAIHSAKDISEIRGRDKELEERVKELEIFYDATVDRELKMEELRREIEQLKER